MATLQKKAFRGKVGPEAGGNSEEALPEMDGQRGEWRERQSEEVVLGTGWGEASAISLRQLHGRLPGRGGQRVGGYGHEAQEEGRGQIDRDSVHEDWEFLDQMASEGVSLGVDEEMPRTPEVFEEKQKWARDFVDYLLEDQFADNYASAEESQQDIRRQVLEEVEAGSIKKMPEEEAKAKFKGRLAVAALGAVPKELGSDKVRLIHDGSYSVDINRRI